MRLFCEKPSTHLLACGLAQNWCWVKYFSDEASTSLVGKLEWSPTGETEFLGQPEVSNMNVREKVIKHYQHLQLDQLQT